MRLGYGIFLEQRKSIVAILSVKLLVQGLWGVRRNPSRIFLTHGQFRQITRLIPHHKRVCQKEMLYAQLGDTLSAGLKEIASPVWVDLPNGTAGQEVPGMS